MKKQSQEDLDINAAKDEMTLSMIESVLPMIQPLIKPATKKFTEFMNDDNMIVAKTVKGKVFFFHIKNKDIKSFELNEGSSPVSSYDLEGFIGKILSGDFSL